ncbi:site-2 protease family protein [Geovibrio thiophilus]|uniref:Site-2 protease family protein n=1 Tax=Geovibrio thiophilus TaxID=139438 RepID=A0A410JY78_9BACT|nr:site-2 protease family protein [Geovibrio thiophilus]QAR33102.1 site-2 protease family protein [Geovibrio thiophilus]
MDFNIAEYIRFMSLAIVPFFFAITVHELSHGVAAYMLGDDTAKRLGRLTLNPFAHIDIVGLLFLLITQLFGWAKPVPVNFSRLRNNKYGMAIVAAAGPVSNIAVALASALLLQAVLVVPIHADTLAAKIAMPIAIMLKLSVQINVALAVFNLIPILPLDGGRILTNFLPYEKAFKFSQTERYGFIIIILLFLTGIFDKTVLPVIRYLTAFLL